MKKTIIVATCALCATVAQAGSTASTINTTTQPLYNSVQVSTFAPSTSSTGISTGFTVDTDRTFTATYTLNPNELCKTLTHTTAGNVAIATIKTTKEDGNTKMNWTLIATPNGLTLDNSALTGNHASSTKYNVNTDTGSGITQINISTGLSTINWSEVTKAAVSVIYYSSGTMLTLTLQHADNTFTSYNGVNTDFKSTSAGDYAPTALDVNSSLVYSAYMFDNTSQNSNATRINLNKAAMAQVPVTTVTTAVPEPATATLSLLALAGLAARRRRK